ncbi:MAG TPA: PQQ-binding-like beta-propeller repeat protein [Tepidisphaeraceae bacterium]|nr:PQQ-binding-like beta-propeller repeat protein [Tepidisphaeraceae bacterium]
MKFCTASLASLLFCTTAIAAAPGAFDWPQWQGPDRNSVSKETGLLKEWPKDGPPLAWKVKGLGGGDGAPSVAAGRIYGMSNRGADEVVWAISESDGKPVWVTTLRPVTPQQFAQSQEGPSCTPTVDGDRLYVVGLTGEISCVNAADGKVVWTRSMMKDFGGRAPMWNFRESPLVDGDKVICTPGGDDAMLVALDKLTGKTIWQAKLPAAAAVPQPENAGGPGRGPGRGFGRGRGPQAGAGYSSAIAIDFGGQRQYVQFTSKAVIGIAATDGKFLWRYDKPANGMGLNITTPLYLDGMIFASSAYGAGGGAVKLTKADDGSIRATELYFSKRMQNHHGGLVVVDGALYGAHGGNEGGNLACLDLKTGEQLWSQRDEGRVKKGSVALADGRIYYREESGTVLLVEPSKTGYVERGRFSQPDRTRLPAWAHPVIANGKLYIRDQDVMYCYDVKAK